VEVQRVDAAGWEELREVRLRALADAPDAFASTLEREAAFPEDVWRQRAQGGPASANFIVREDGVGVGMAAVIPEPDPGRMQLVGMWVDPRHRHRGIAQALIGEAVRWSREHQARELIAWVAESNRCAPAAALQPRGRRGPAAPAPGPTGHRARAAGRVGAYGRRPPPPRLQAILARWTAVLASSTGGHRALFQLR
jgi:GNAT superfamily N-acetyltransferase